MLTTEEFHACCGRLQLSKETEAIIPKIRVINNQGNCRRRMDRQDFRFSNGVFYSIRLTGSTNLDD